MAFEQYQNELIDKESLDSVLTPLVAFLELMEPAKPRWEQLRPVLNAGYVNYVDKKIELGSVVQ
ncbi:MAG TPA: hypothetical protein DDZ21_08145 [Gammaproteobacteria bacterium]|nr:hypothetical protein [Gammaproteobacteria bacterium]